MSSIKRKYLLDFTNFLSQEGFGAKGFSKLRWSPKLKAAVRTYLSQKSLSQEWLSKALGKEAGYIRNRLNY